MVQKVEKARRLGFKSAKLCCSSLLERDGGVGPLHDLPEDESVLADKDAGGYQLLFASPEALLESDTWKNVIQLKNLRALVIDEAQCILDW